ncbi:ATP-grasp domain-containing protein [Solitalea koreensis]|uniref:PylC N-terminal domain-containing protein n=1 Tax=Solitalea koreensis TaxID=543615 RepID=A0A521BQ45_9SPHI|nr:hypothetical protein [Solitalea koreensis]SMO49292.1 hypothetical protein SAMN06265350_102417 [Solitalea koreensis]
MKILITGATTASAEYIYNCLSNQSFELILSDSAPLVGEKFIRIPSFVDPAFAHKILTTCLDNQISAVIPLLSEEVKLLAQAKMLFGEYGVKILAPDKKVLDIITSSAQLYTFFNHRKVKVPAFKRVMRFEEISKALISLGYPSQKVKIQPDNNNNNNNNGLQQLIVDDQVSTDNLLFPDTAKPLINFELLNRILKKDDFSPIVLSEYSESELFNVHVLAENGAVVKFTRQNEEGALVSGLVEHITKELDLDGYFILTFQPTANVIQLVAINHLLQGSSKITDLNFPLLYLNKELALI